MLIIGLNAFHGDSSACIVRDGKLVAAVEEERLRRIKHWAGFPSESIRYCLKEAGAELKDVDVVAVNQDNRSNLWRKVAFGIRHRPRLDLVAKRLRNRSARSSVPDLLEEHFGADRFKGSLLQVDHHLAHLSSAFHVSPFEEATVVSIDGFGDFSSAGWGLGRGSEVGLDGQIYFPHSLGIFYEALTQFVGFPHYGDEYKVMGLAPYGEPKYLAQMREIVKVQRDGEYRLNLDYFNHHREDVAFSWEGGAPVKGCLFTPAMEELLGPARVGTDPLEQRHRDLARSIQAMYEEAFFELINSLQDQHGSKSICLAGGCAMNSVANGKVRRQSGFERVYVQSAAGDAGGAIGAAMVAWHQGGGARNFTMNHAYWGPSFDEDEIASTLAAHAGDIEKADCSPTIVADEQELYAWTARAIADGKVIGWFQGRLEWGPRALGNRSILGDPRRADMKDILNSKIKRRESFRPFAPSVLEELVPDWFEEDDDVPFMMQVFQIREERRKQVPAVTHVDGSGRLQTVSKKTNPRYHGVISAFNALTGVPMVLNTSFNENEPIVCTPEQALECFLRTEMDVLVLGNTYLERGGGGVSSARLPAGDTVHD